MPLFFFFLLLVLFCFSAEVFTFLLSGLRSLSVSISRGVSKIHFSFSFFLPVKMHAHSSTLLQQNCLEGKQCNTFSVYFYIVEVDCFSPCQLSCRVSVQGVCGCGLTSQGGSTAVTVGLNPMVSAYILYRGPLSHPELPSMFGGGPCPVPVGVASS